MIANTNRIKSLLTGLVVFVLTLAPVELVFAQHDLGSILDIAGEQRMLSQRIAKSYIMIAAQINPAKGQEQLQSSILKFEKNMEDLTAFSPNEKISASLKKVKSVWAPYRQIALAEAEKKSVKKIMNDSDELLKYSQQLVDQISAYGKQGSASIVATSGKQRMLSQKMAKFYLAYFIGFHDAEVVSGFKSSLDDYENGLKELEGYHSNTDSIKVSLHKVKTQWEFSKQGLNSFPDEKTMVPFMLTVTTESMLKKMDGITKMYARLYSDKKT